MTNINNNLPPVEEIREIKGEYKTPSFEEFMRDYKVDSNLNYADLGHRSLGDSKGYGPTRFLWEEVTYSFHLRIECHNWDGFGQSVEVNSIYEAWEQFGRLTDGSWNNSGWISNDVLNKCADLVEKAIYESDNWSIDGYVRVKGRFWGGYDAKIELNKRK